jgi:L-seryl-tRNA(Ser) seleniumtransferase
LNEHRPPSVSRVLETAEGRDLAVLHGHTPATDAVRAAIAIVRETGITATPEEVAQRATAALNNANRARLRPIWNLTGTVLHTNLGRAQLSEQAIAAASAAMERPVALEYDLDAGGRGERDDLVRELLVELTGAEASVLVNNNAAAVLLVLDTLARGGEVIVSRGELIEIGGAFRLPDIMAATGAKLREVGTTNRTHLKDYIGAINEDTRMILKVHPSNYRIEGFTKEVSAAELAPIARERGIPLVNDLGSGTFTDLSQYGLPREPTAREAVSEGADIVTFSGDKLLGGPQAGLAVGRADLIAKLKKNPLKRALRLDKIRLAALEAVLRDYRAGRANPTQIFLGRSAEDIGLRAQAIAPRLAESLGAQFSVEAIACESQVGSGASPTATMPSAGIAISRTGSVSLANLATALRGLDEPVIGRIRDGALLLDLRCLLPGQEEAFLANLAELSLGAR